MAYHVNESQFVLHFNSFNGVTTSNANEASWRFDLVPNLRLDMSANYNIALMHASVPNRYVNILSTHVYFKTAGRWSSFLLPDSHIDNALQFETIFRDVIPSPAVNLFQLKYSPDEQRFQFQVKEVDVQVRFEDQLLRQLGFEDGMLFKFGTSIARQATSFFRGSSHLTIGSELVTNLINDGNERSSGILLASSIKDVKATNFIFEPVHLQYKPLKFKSLSQLQLEVRDDKGKLLSFVKPYDSCLFTLKVSRESLLLSQL